MDNKENSQPDVLPEDSPPKPPKKRKDWGAFGCLVLVVILLYAHVAPSMLNSRRPAWMSRAKGTLRSIGSSEFAYQNGNSAKRFGSFQALQKSENIARGYTQGNMIENYSMTWVAQTLSTVQGEISKYTVIAWPRDTRPGVLSTFGITEDEIVRIYNPKNRKSRLGNVKTWDPIM